ncbi:TetR/AcrR family transcriptional regulator [Paeniroseomonas aquatica]|uniref:TetR/AcrR family transcriptional regulator n=1 Tax=Paeniroseomonas aquatica TaxID=373043 RepID=A0ABT8A6K9_9PROT|nr:TetR/AcrR family transcriptional regulator [Paeniroseomonas aquatica]MDN3565432.1 TetR/AcrR family transcriptional regulator [Paeniroseomonas aquatica]
MSTSTTIAPRRLSEAERRSALIQAAETVFLRQGYAAANMDDVAQAVGMSKKTLYQLYPSKEALFDAVVTRFCAPMQVAAEPTARGDAAALAGLLADVALHILSPRHVALFRVIASEVNRAPELAAAVQRSRGRGTGVVEQWLAEQAALGWLRLEDPEQAAGMLIGMVVGEPHMLMLLGQRPPPDAEEIRKRAGQAVAIFLEGAASGA